MLRENEEKHEGRADSMEFVDMWGCWGRVHLCSNIFSLFFVMGFRWLWLFHLEMFNHPSNNSQSSLFWSQSSCPLRFYQEVEEGISALLLIALNSIQQHQGPVVLVGVPSLPLPVLQRQFMLVHRVCIMSKLKHSTKWVNSNMTQIRPNY